ncbi:hypothetical protein J8L98_01355 [Pseudoalteromonas sp. MMG013]|uniref:hypothetical protein n=1 Tax=Pseudoalteromonas sp. MMG013 TaxID=2822687 RepID=UPI001B367135|nr:hypothetical protein [Pseudoalteromonas sp. MMG013]MBQ4860336.1 hypothetical protein [Pseudoalteromonas sp. MMG013]
MTDVKNQLFNELERSAMLEKQVEKASPLNIKQPALALIKSQRKLIAMLAHLVLEPGHTKGGANG